MSSRLNGVSCVGTTFCFAVGERSGPNSGLPIKTLVERWNGKTWAVVSSPNSAKATNSRLSAVSCASSTFCIAVGREYASSTNTVKALIERWDGKAWSIVATPTVAGADGLSGVSCTSATFCFAVGGSLTERWNGKAWSIVSMPAQTGSLESVYCISPTSCFAVGVSHSSTPRAFDNTAVARWNGKSWSVVPSPTPTLGDGGPLQSVSCVSVSYCVAAGYYLIGGFFKPASLLEHWDGKRWKIDANPNPARSYSRLQGVSCIGTTNCAAVGNYEQFAGPPTHKSLGVKTLMERWNGKTWSIVTTPIPANFSFFEAVSCPIATSCAAVGYSSKSPSGATKTLVEHWNGKTWSIVPSPNAG